jgi:hypothetical protein
MTYNGKLIYKPHPKQLQFHADTASYTLIAGGIGGSKTTALVMQILISCLKYPGILALLARKRFSNFQMSTKKIWEKMVPRELYKDNEQKHEFTVFTGKKQNSTVFYGGFDTTDSVSKFLSTEYGIIAIDQAEEMTPEDYGQICTRLRQTLKDEQGNIYKPHYRRIFAANPRRCFLREAFVESPDSDHHMIISNAADNPSLPEGYIEDARKAMSHLSAEIVAALIDGSWDISDSETTIIPYGKIVAASKRFDSLAYTDKRLVSIDVAREGDDKTAIVGWNGTMIAEKEIYGKKDLEFTAAKSVAMLGRIGGNSIIWDADGIGGGMMSNLKPIIQPKTTLIEFHGNGKVDDPRYFNARAEACFEAAELFNNDLMAIPCEPILMGEIGQPRFEYRLGKLKVESKEEIKDRIKKSPDEADAVFIGIYGLKRAPSCFVRKPIRKGSFAEALLKSNNIEDDESELEAIGSNHSKYW